MSALLESTPQQMELLGKKELEQFKKVQSKYGSRKNIFALGKKPGEKEFLHTPKLLKSSYDQMSVIFDYNDFRIDKREIRMAVAQKKKVNKYLWVPEDVYNLMTSCDTEEEFERIRMARKQPETGLDEIDNNKPIIETVPFIPDLKNKPTETRFIGGILRFDFSKIKDEDDLTYIKYIIDTNMSAMLGEYYEAFFDYGDDKSKELARKYGDIKEYYLYKIQYTLDTMEHEFFTYDELKEKRPNKRGRKPSDYHGAKDTYLGAPTLIKNKRSTDNIAEISMLYADIDYYNVAEYKDLGHWEIYELMVEELKKNDIPGPDIMEVSRGVTLKWRISPIGDWKLNHWRALQERIHEVLKKFGSDSSVTKDPVRLSRLMGSVHSLTNQSIFGYILSEERYNFEKLLAHCLPDYYEDLQKRREHARNNIQKKAKTTQNRHSGNKVDHKTQKQLKVFFDANLPKEYFNLNYKHLRIVTGLHQLVEIRMASPAGMIGYREFLLFLIRYFYLCMTGSTRVALNRTKDMYYAIEADEKYSWEEIKQFTKSAVKGWENWKKDKRKGYNYKIPTIIEKFDITYEEQRKIDFLKGEEAKKDLKDKLNQDYYKQQRKSEGKMSREEKKELRVALIKEELEKKPDITVRELEKNTEIPKSAVHRLLTEIQS